MRDVRAVASALALALALGVGSAASACSASRPLATNAPRPAASACTVREDHGGSAIAAFAMTFVFDARGRLVEVTRTAPDGVAHRTRSLDEAGRVVSDRTIERDASGAVVVERRHTITRDASGQRRQSRYEELAATDGGAPATTLETVDYAWDDQGRLLRVLTKNEEGETTRLEERAYATDGTAIVQGRPDRQGGAVAKIHLRVEGSPPRVTERVTELTEPSTSTTVERFLYDAHARLVRVDGRTTLERPPRVELGAVSFSYDDAGRCDAMEKSYPDEPGTGIVETVKRGFTGTCGEAVRLYFDPRAIYESAFDDDDD